MQAKPATRLENQKRLMNMKINQNKLAQRISQREGGKTNLSIAQIKEVLKANWEILAEDINDLQIMPSDVLKLIERYQ